MLFDLFIVLAHFFQVEALVLQRVSELMGHHRTLHFRLIPVQQIHGARFFVVVAGHLFREQLDEKAVQIKGARQQPEFFFDQLRALKADAVSIVLELVSNVLFHLRPAHDGPLDLFLDRQACIFAGKAQNLIDRPEKFFGFRRSDLMDFFDRLDFNAVGRRRALRLRGRGCWRCAAWANELRRGRLLLRRSGWRR